MPEPRAQPRESSPERRQDRPLVFVGPLSAPVNGFSTITRRMHEVLQGCVPLLEVEMSPSVPRGRRLRSALGALSRILTGHAAGVYVAFSGGLRQLFDLPFALAARMTGSPVYVHHHNFSYIDRWKATTWLNMLLLRNATHIVLCDCMADALSARYGLPRGNMLVLSNAAFLEAAPARRHRVAGSPMVLGFLSNITAEKGIFDFFRIVEELSLQGFAPAVKVAGPLAPAIAERFGEELRRLPQVTYVGPVYGESKQRFLLGLDILVFPTRYRNEAEPVTILEALAHGVVVAAYARGCIGEVLPASVGVVAVPGEDAADRVAHGIGRLLDNPRMLQLQSGIAVERAVQLAGEGALILESFRRTVAGGQPAAAVPAEAGDVDGAPRTQPEATK
jgi:glycosyltransferase involved in cell wall biosynthesis